MLSPIPQSPQVNSNVQQGSFLMPGLKTVPRDTFITLSDNVLGSSNSIKLLSAYNITPTTDSNLFWTNLSYLMGDVMFSSPTHNLAQSLASSSNKNIYRYSQMIRNPFPGSPLYHVSGPHSIDNFFLFGTLRERYPTQKLRDLSEEFGKRWLRFAVGLEPRSGYVKGDEKIMVIHGRSGFELRSRDEDVMESAKSEEGARRYGAWEVIAEVLKDLASGERGIVKGEEARMEWGTDGGVFRLAGLAGPYGVVIPEV